MRNGRAFIAAMLIAILIPAVSMAAWLDTSPPASWNRPGMAVSRAPEEQGNDDPRCRQGERPPESPEDRQVVAHGWRLFRGYQAGWGVRIVWALSSYDGMCRPMGYQVFVFANGALAGTLAPQPMASRTDGSLISVDFFGPGGGTTGDRLTAAFNRYAASDPLCCPSGRTTVQYRLERSAGRPVLMAVSAATSTSSP